MFVVGLFIVPSAEFIFFASDSLNCAASIVQKCLNIFLIFSKFSYPQRKPVMKNFKTKTKSLYHLSNFNSPLPSNLPPPAPGPFLLLVVVRHFSHFLCLSWFRSVWKYPHSAYYIAIDHSRKYHNIP